MIRSILVPLDGSRFGEHALPLALDLARRARVAIHLVQVATPSGLLAPEAPLLTTPSLLNRIAEQRRKVQHAYLDSVAKRLRDADAPRVLTWLPDGEVAAMLRQQVKDTDAGLVVMSTHGRGPLARFWLGSVADELVRTSPVPLILVRPTEEAPDLEKPPPLKHFLIPLDGSPLSEQILAPVTKLGTELEADYTLLRVVRPAGPKLYPVERFALTDMVDETLAFAEKEEEVARTAAENYLARVAEPLRERDLTVVTRVEVDESPAAAVLRYGAGADLVALATHGRKGLSRLFLGSVADKIVRAAVTPVLVLRPKEE